MAAPGGIAAQLGYAEEDTFGTYKAPDHWVEFTQENLALDRRRQESRGLRAGRRMLHRWDAGTKRAGGSFEIELAAQGTGLLFGHLFGTTATTGSDPYTHTFTPGELSGDSLTIQVGKPDIGGTVRAFSYLGCKLTGASIRAVVDEYPTASFSVYGVDVVTSEALATATYPSDLAPFTFLEATLDIAAAEVNVKEIGVDFATNLVVDRHRLRTTTPERSLEPLEGAALREITGSIVADFEDLTAYNRFVNGTEAALVVTFSDGTHSFTLTLNVRFDGETPQVGGPGELSQPLPFKAVSATSDAAAATLVLINGDATP